MEPGHMEFQKPTINLLHRGLGSFRLIPLCYFKGGIGGCGESNSQEKYFPLGT